MLLIVGLYVASANLALSYFSYNSIVTRVWPPSGIAIAYLILWGLDYWPAVVVGAFFANLSMGSNFLVSVGIAAGNTLEALIAVWLLTRNRNIELAVKSSTAFFRFVVGAVALSPAIAAINGVTVMWFAGTITQNQILSNFFSWWMGDSFGILLMVPFILFWSEVPKKWSYQKFKWFCLLGLSTFAGQIIFLNWLNSIFGFINRGYWMFLFVVAIAIELGGHGVTLFLITTTIQALVGAVTGVGFFESDVKATGLFNFWFYMIILSLIGNTLAIVFTERSKNEEALRKLSTVVDQSPTSIVITDLDANIQYANPKFCEVTGYTFGESLGQNPRILQSKLTPSATYADMWDKLTNGKSWQGELINKRKNGDIYYELAHIAPVKDSFDNITSYVAVKTDISEIKYIEHKLQESYYYARSLIEASLDPFVTIDINGTITDVNSATEKMIGLPRNKLINTEFASYFTDTESAKIGFQLVWEKGELRDYPLSIQNIHGTMTEVLYSATLYRSQTGNPLGVFAAARDITERKKMMDELKLAASVFSNSYNGILIADHNNIILDISPSFTRDTGYSRDELIGQTPKILKSGLHKSDFYAQMWNSISKDTFWAGEIWNRRKNGEIYPEMLSISVVKDKDNKPKHYVGIFSDISTIKNQEAILIESRKQAEAATISKSRFLATMSHEIRTPLNGILGMAQLLTMPNISDSERIEYARTITNSGRILLTLLNDILDLTKVESGKIELENIAFDPLEIIHDSAMLFIEPAKAKSLRLEIDNKITESKVFLGDPNRIRQMLSNLISNAIKFTEKGYIRIEVKEFAKSPEESDLEFAVIDSGIGIPDESLNKLFTPFTQADNSTSRKYGGSGLGLSIVANMSKLMRGDCGVTSNSGVGSRFWVKLPCSIKNASNSNFRSWKPVANDFNSKEHFLMLHGNVLVVDDDPVNRLVIEKFLTKLGITPIIAKNGEEALNYVKCNKAFDLILMDLQMPVMDGYETVTQIRQWENEVNRLPSFIVAFTADAFSETHEICLAKGMNDILTKPVSMDTLRQLIQSVFAHRKVG